MAEILCLANRLDVRSRSQASGSGSVAFLICEGVEFGTAAYRNA